MNDLSVGLAVLAHGLALKCLPVLAADLAVPQVAEIAPEIVAEIDSVKMTRPQRLLRVILLAPLQHAPPPLPASTGG